MNGSQLSVPQPQSLFITGTDTGVGKTLISSALIHKFAQQGKRVVGMKPVAAGCGWVDPPEFKGTSGSYLLSEDVAQLRAASNVESALADINPYAFMPPVAPHIAAQELGTEIELEVIKGAYERLSLQADMVVVEGVGGFRVPLGEGFDTADLAQELGLPVILVVGMRLGCLSHALLTAEAIERRGLFLAGWVANCIDPQMARYDENLQALRQRLPAPCLGVLPWLGNADFSAAAAYLQLTV